MGYTMNLMFLSCLFEDFVLLNIQVLVRVMLALELINPHNIEAYPNIIFHAQAIPETVFLCSE